MGITSSGFYLKDTFLNGEKRDIEGSAPQIEDEHVLFIAFLVKTVCNSSSGRLVDDTKTVQSSNGCSILGCLTLSIIEVSWYGDHSVLHFFANVSLSDLFHLGENHGTDLFRSKRLLFAFEVHNNGWFAASARNNLEWPMFHVRLDSLIGELAANQSLCIEHGVGCVHCNLILCSITNETLSVIECHVRWGGAISLIICDDLNTVVLPYSNA
mmetsp:Transcript_42227/g.54375  ORF Transcript_42227/g.54375 Transcript_42227/m.54375 type:complete len:212 (-) Transcript_42227:124-759(-)